MAGVSSAKMKAVGRGMAKVANQKAGKMAPYNDQDEDDGMKGGANPGYGAGSAKGSNGGRGNSFKGGVR